MHKYAFGFGLGCLVTALYARYEAEKTFDGIHERAQQRVEMWRDAVLELAVEASPEAVLRVAERLQFDSLMISNDLPIKSKEEGTS